MTPEVVVGPHAGHRAVADAAPVRAPGRREGRQDGVCANIDFPFPGTLVDRALALAAGTDPDARPLAARAGGLAAHRGGGGALRRALAGTPGRSTCRNSATVEGSKRVLEHPARGRPLRPLRRAPAGHAAALGRRIAAKRDEAAWQVELWRLLRERIGRAEPGRAAGRRLPAPAGRARPSRPAAPALAVRADPAARQLPRRPGGRRCGPRRPPLPVAPVAGAVGPAGGRGRADVALRRCEARTRRPACRATRSWRRGAATPGRCSWCSAARWRTASSTNRHRMEARGRCCSRIQDDVRADRAPAGARGRLGGRPSAPGGRRRQPPRPFLPRSGAAGRGAARRHPAPARGRSDPRAPRHHRDVPGHRDLRAADPGHVRRHDDDDPTTRPTHSRSVWPIARSARPTRSWRSWPRCSSLRRRGSRRPRSSTWRAGSRSAAGSSFGDEDLFRLEEWVDEACVRWGFDAAHRRSFQLEGIGSNTWRSGLDRILLGVTMADERQRLFVMRSRWTTSTAPTSSWPVAWPSSSTGSTLRSTCWPSSAPSTPGRAPWRGSRIR